nr:type II toxin-antitoxin system PemK/MazF family toxin [Beijerinckia sp. L45]
MRRGHIVVVATQGDAGKPRPALVVQSDLFAPLPSVAICPITSTLREDSELLRVDIEATSKNGLRLPSQISVDKMTTVRRDKIGGIIGDVDDATILRVNRALAVLLGLA